MRKFSFLIFLLSLIIFFTACNDETGDPAYPGGGRNPIEIPKVDFFEIYGTWIGNCNYSFIQDEEGKIEELAMDPSVYLLQFGKDGYANFAGSEYRWEAYDTLLFITGREGGDKKTFFASKLDASTFEYEVSTPASLIPEDNSLLTKRFSLTKRNGYIPTPAPLNNARDILRNWNGTYGVGYSVYSANKIIENKVQETSFSIQFYQNGKVQWQDTEYKWEIKNNMLFLTHEDSGENLKYTIVSLSPSFLIFAEYITKQDIYAGTKYIHYQEYEFK